jgi:hypothetical protein
MKITSGNKKSIYALAVLGPIAAYLVYSNLLSGPSYPTVRPPAPGGNSETAAATPDKAGPDISRAQDAPARPSSRAKETEFRPKLRSKKKEDQIAHIEDIDPTLRLDLLAKVMKVPPAGGERDLFQIAKTPPVKAAAPEQLAGVEPKVQPYVFVGPRLPAPPPPPPAPPPPHVTPIPLKYYAVSSIRPDGKRTAYFISPGPDGDEILEATEGTVLKGRYRIVQISVDKVVIEDTQEKRRQPVNIEPEVTG